MLGSGCLTLNTGIRIPSMAQAISESTQTRPEWDAFDQAEFDQGISDFFDLAFAKVERGEMTYAQVERFLFREE